MHLIEFIEVSSFARYVYRYLSDEAYQGLQHYLMAYPDAGSMIPGTGGCRKLRWAAKGRGKRGGIRVLYSWRRNQNQIWMLMIYAKDEEENVPTPLVRRLRE